MCLESTKFNSIGLIKLNFWQLIEPRLQEVSEDITQATLVEVAVVVAVARYFHGHAAAVTPTVNATG